MTFKPERSFNTDFKAGSDKFHKSTKPPQDKKITAFEDPNVFDKAHPLRHLTEGNVPQFDEDDDEDSRFVFEESPKTADVISLSKILNGYMGLKPNPQKENKSPTKQKSVMHSRQGSYLADLSYLENKEIKQVKTPPKAQTESPFNFNLIPATQLQEQTNKGYEENIAPPSHTTTLTMNLIPDNSSIGGVLQPRETNKTNNISRPSELKNLLKPSFPQTRPSELEFQKPKIVTMVPKFMSNVPANPFSAGFNMNPLSGMPPSGLQLHEYSSSDNRYTAKHGSKVEEDNLTGPSRRFSLNPLSFLGHNMDQLDKRLGIKDGAGRNLRSSGQRGDITENFGTIADRRASYGVPVNQNMSAGIYGQGISERRMYQY
jgi:hypothetical protein